MQTLPRHHFKTHIANMLMDKGLFDASWFKSQEKRLNMYYDCGETVDSAFETVHAFAEGQLTKNFSFPTRESMEAVGCDIHF